jgi:hypothetical protein
MYNIGYFRLLSGEDILSEYSNNPTNQNEFELTNPILIITIPPKGPNLPPNVGFAPWLPYSKETKFNIDARFVISVSEPMDMLVTQYKAMLSNIALPNKPKIIIPGK